MHFPRDAHDLDDKLFQFPGFCGEFVEKSERFLLAVDRMNGLDALIVVSPDGPELFVKFGQADEKIVRVAVAHRDAKRSVEEACTDKIRRTAVLCLPHHRQESFVFLVVELQVVAVCLWVGQHFASGGISVRASHRHIISCSRFDLEEPFAVQSFCAALSGGRIYFGRPKVPLAVAVKQQKIMIQNSGYGSYIIYPGRAVASGMIKPCVGRVF